MKRTLSLIVLIISILSTNIFAQYSPQNSSDILLSLQKLNTVSSVLYVAAHPDDENTRLLGYLANEKHLRTGYLSLTRGDGGQNLIGKEQGEMLGLIRTQELLAARRTDGAEQFFTRANDFGYSKNPEETFTIWNKDSVLADVVWAIRRFKPDVIICRFPTTGEGGHGHHTASAILAEEAFKAAANANIFPEQLKYTEIWQAKRIFWNTFNFGGANTTNSNQLKMDVGMYNPLLGKGYGEIAAESRSNHKSQGFGSSRQRGSTIEYFKLLKGDTAISDVMEGVNVNWAKFSGTEKIQTAINECIKNFSPLAPENSVSALVNIYKLIQNLPNTDKTLIYWKIQKLKETENLILACSGLYIEAAATDYIGIAGQDININAQIVNRNKTEVMLKGITFLEKTDTSINKTLAVNELYTFKHKEKIAADANYSNPYWLNEKHDIGMYKVNNQLLVGKPENEAAAKVFFNITINGLDLKIERGLIYKSTDPVKGEVYRPFEILPPATVNIMDKVLVFSDETPKTVQITVKANANNIIGILKLKAADGWKINIAKPDFTLVNKGDEVILEATITASKNTANAKLEAEISIDNATYNKAIKRIEYDHIPYQYILSKAEANLVNVELKKTGINIGYIAGAGDDVPACLKQVGYNVTLISDEQLTNDNLQKYNSIVTGVRAYNTNKRLQIHYDKLMEYIKNGGNLVVQYNTNNRIGPVSAKIGPYPFTITNERVTNEKAEITFSDSKSKVLNFPNKITSKDFDGWIQERGIYFATELDKNYSTMLSLNDPNEAASKGSLIVAPYGKGNFVYTGLVFFRELPAGVPGAYRLFANILSLPMN